MQTVSVVKILISAVLTAGVLAGCAKNPVTGKNEISLVGQQWELDVGRQNYSPLRQSQGGDYVADPAVEKYVKEVGLKLAAVSDRKLPYEFNVINDSTPNAWALPGGKIAINRGLLTELESEAELAAVLGHEIVHAAARHGARAQTRGLGLQAFVVGATIGLSDRLGGQGAQILSSVGAQLINQKYSRDAELESDLYGMKYMAEAGYDLRGAVELQQTFVKLSAGRGQSGFEKLFASHPASEERVRRNRATAAKFGPGGTDGRERYQRVMKTLIKTKPAYEAFEQARAAYNKGEKSKAESLVKKAIRIQPREALFHSAMGDIVADKKQFAAARKHFDKAISLNSDYFYYYLRRGQMNRVAKNFTAARRDLQKSIELLPTPDAQEQLGDVARLTNDPATAKKQYQLAARSGGQSAQAKLLSLDLEENPSAYLQTRQGVSNRGTLAVQITNSTKVSLSNITVTVLSRASGKRVNRSVKGVLKGGGVTVLDTGIPIKQNQLGTVQVGVTDAQVAR